MQYIKHIWWYPGLLLPHNPTRLMAEGCQTGTMVCHQQVFVLFCLNLLSFFYFLPFFKYLFQTYEQLGGETRHKGKNSDENLNSLSWNSKSIFYNAMNNLPKLKLSFFSNFLFSDSAPPRCSFSTKPMLWRRCSTLVFSSSRRRRFRLIRAAVCQIEVQVESGGAQNQKWYVRARTGTFLINSYKL